MQQVDLQTSISVRSGAASDRKISCETLASTSDNQNHLYQPESESEPDLPPESFWLSKDAELDWFDRNAFYERKDSTKGNSNPNSTNLNPNINPNPNFKKSKPSIIGLPLPQKARFIDAKNRRNCNLETPRLFPKRSGSMSKSESSVKEPSSPKVSCMGKVRSRKDRKLRNSQRSTRSNESGLDKEKPQRTQRTGFFASFIAIFKRSKNERETTPCSNELSEVKTHNIMEKLPATERETLRRSVRVDRIGPAASEPVGLGGMKRFVSGRRSESLV